MASAPLPRPSKGPDLTFTRILNAPRELVFKAWTDPKQMAQWWGPRVFTNPVCEMDVRPGGVWRFVMHSPDGTDYDNKVVFVEVARPERLVYDHGPGDESDSPQFRVTVTFEQEGGKTRLTLRLVFASAAERDRAVEFGALEGGNQTLERLAEHLAKA